MTINGIDKQYWSRYSNASTMRACNTHAHTSARARTEHSAIDKMSSFLYSHLSGEYILLMCFLFSRRIRFVNVVFTRHFLLPMLGMPIVREELYQAKTILFISHISRGISDWCGVLETGRERNYSHIIARASGLAERTRRTKNDGRPIFVCLFHYYHYWIVCICWCLIPLYHRIRSRSRSAVMSLTTRTYYVLLFTCCVRAVARWILFASRIFGWLHESRSERAAAKSHGPPMCALPVQRVLDKLVKHCLSHICYANLFGKVHGDNKNS